MPQYVTTGEIKGMSRSGIEPELLASQTSVLPLYYRLDLLYLITDQVYITTIRKILFLFLSPNFNDDIFTL